MSFVRKQLAILLPLLTFGCSNATNPSSDEAKTFCDKYMGNGEWIDAEIQTEFEHFASLANGAFWTPVKGVFSLETEWLGLNWYGSQNNDSAANSLCKRLGDGFPMSFTGIYLHQKNATSWSNRMEIPLLNERAIVLIPAMFQQAEAWRDAYLSLKEKLFYEFDVPKPYTNPELERTWLTSRTSGDYLMLAYYASKAGKEKLIAKNILLSGLVGGGTISCKDTLDSRLSGLPAVPRGDGECPAIQFEYGDGEKEEVEKKRFSISRAKALDSIRTMYIEEKLQQRVMWLAEQGLVKPLSVEERETWEGMEKAYCSPDPAPCGIMGSATDGPIGYGKALEEEWAAGD